MEQEEEEVSEDLFSVLKPREIDSESCFLLMTKRLEGLKLSGPSLEETLASNIDNVSINSLKEKEYNIMVKEESLPRQENSTALQTTKFSCQPIGMVGCIEV